MKKKIFAILILMAIVAITASLAVACDLCTQKEAMAVVSVIGLFGMAAATAEVDTDMRSGDSISAGVAASKKIWKGSLVALDASGNATPGAVATTLLGAGRAEETVDNSSGAAGDLAVQIRKGIFRYGNSAAADEITIAEIGDNCYIVDDQTVAKTDGTSTRSVAGKVFDVDSDGVWVKFD
jgi:hypothetical protein